MQIGVLARRILPWAVFAAFLTPLLIVQGLWYPAVAPKTFFLETIGILVAALFSISALGGGAFYWGRLKRFIAWLPLILLGVEYLTSFIGIDFYRSFWGTMVRGEGLLMTTLLTLLFYVILLIADEQFWKKLFRIVSVVSSISAVVALAQWFFSLIGVPLPAIVPGADRVGGLFGNAAYLASYLALSGIFTLLYAQEYAPLARVRLWKMLGWLQLVVVVLTATRGSIAALGVAGIIVLVYMARGAHAKRARVALMGLALLFVLGLALRGPLSHVPFEPVSRIAAISLTDPTVSSRLFIWNAIGAEAFKHSLTGVGAEHVTQLFDRIYDPSKIAEAWFDRSHNAYLDYFAQYGAAGITLYILIIVLLGRGAYRIWKQEGSSRYGLLALATVVYAIQVFFAFDIPSTLLLFLTLYAMLLSRDGEVSSLKFSYGFVAVGALLAVAFLASLYVVVYKPLMANRYLVQGYLYQISDVGQAIQYFQKGLALNTYADAEYGYQIEDMYVTVQAPTLKGQALEAAYGFDASTLLGLFKQYPYDARTALDLSQVLDSVPPTVRPNLVLQVQAAARARELSPLRAESWYLMVNADLTAAAMATSDNDKLDYYADAIGAMKDYSSKVRTLSRPKLILAQLYLTVGDTASAKTYIKDLERTDPEILQSDPGFYEAIQALGLL